MIVCKQCGNHNSADDEFCGSCGVFLEWEGERIVDNTPKLTTPATLPPPVGIVSKIKHAVLGDGASLPPPASTSSMAPPNPGSTSPGSTSPSTSGAGSSSGARTPGRQPFAAPVGDTAASALVAKQAPSARPPTGDAPTGRAPSAEGPRPKPQVKQPPSKTVNPGDLVCGTCGEGNSGERKFCRRCGTSLAEVIPVKKKWWQRSGGTHSPEASGAPAGSRHAVPAGTRKSGRSSSGARKVKSGLFGGVNSIRRVLALLAVLGLGTAIAVPSLRSTITDKAGDIFNSAKQAVNPEYTQVSPDNTLSTSTSAVAGHEATMIADGGSNTYWIAAPDSVDATASVTFTPPTDIAKVLITPGDQEKPENFKAMPRPKDVFISALDASGTVLKSKQLNLEDKADPQEIEFEVGDAVTVTLSVQSCYPDPALGICAISEIEFFKEK